MQFYCIWVISVVTKSCLYGTLICRKSRGGSKHFEFAFVP